MNTFRKILQKYNFPTKKGLCDPPPKKKKNE